MIFKSEIEDIITNDLKKVIETEIFYQYAVFDVALKEILLKQSLKFSDPNTFNDPFDCNEKLLRINYDEKLVEETINNLSVKISRQERRELKRKFKNQSNQAEILKEKRKEYKLSCFSEVNNEVLMWSYYADKHSGICIGFNFPHKYDGKFILCPVKYLAELRELDGATDLYRIILYWLTTKSIRWKYEKEIRAISRCKDQKSEHEYINYESKYVKEIIFGCNVPDKKIEEAIEKIRKSNLDFNNITIKRMIINENNFLLSEKTIKPCK
ncbi:DUF2971 domain-containing protein [Saccharicrinis sp. FJH62]|uniref:DUF2971 domain-containing protein n=1 Tax=Saccharicrinis sp. FJH62 TaxID=3344657 RepID=UPI0035D4F088